MGKWQDLGRALDRERTIARVDLTAVRARQRRAMAEIVAESESIEAIACQGVLIGHDIPMLIAEIELLRTLVDGRA